MDTRNKSNCEHEYTPCLTICKGNISKHKYTKVLVTEYCIKCGKIGNVDNNRMWVKENGLRRFLTNKELLETYMLLPVFTVNVLDNYVPISKGGDN